MEEQDRLQTILMDIAARYINIELAEVENVLTRTLGEMAVFVEADRAYIFDYDWDRQTCSNTYEWCGDGISPEIDNLQDIPTGHIPQWADAHKQGKTMYIPDVSALPENDGVREILEPQGVKSLIALPVMNGQQCVGFIGFDSVQKHHTYSEREQTLLLLFAQMIVNVRNRQKSYITLQNYAAELEEKNVQLYNALTRARDADRIKSDFLANMSHELKTPMNAVTGFTYSLGRTDLTQSQQDIVRKIENSARKMQRIITSLFDFSSTRSGTLELVKTDFNLDHVLAEATRTASKMAGEKGVMFAIERALDVPLWLKGDAKRLEQAIENLVDNAVKFTETGRVDLHITCESRDADGTRLRFCFTDTGIGMTGRQVKQLFTPFTQADTSSTRQFGGTGLGLVLVKNIVELMNGTITVESEQEKGSCFCIDIPFLAGRPVMETPEKMPENTSACTDINMPESTPELLSRDLLDCRMAELKALLEEYDTGAVQVLGEIKATLVHEGYSKEVQLMTQTLAEYNFDKALAVLTTIEQK
jgi:signal transduction histidine kinase